MMVIRPEDVKHKIQLIRLLTAIADTPTLAHALKFKGGTSAAMRGFLDRFSIDLDFDLDPNANKSETRLAFHKVFKKLDLTIKDKSKRALVFFLRYDGLAGERNTLKLDALSEVWKSNEYEVVRLAEIDRLLTCQTRRTMVANKLVAPLDRWKKHKTIAGRDIYDIHYFLSHGFGYKAEILRERTNLDPKKFFDSLISFIESKVSDQMIREDLSTLLRLDHFQRIYKTLKTETLIILRNEQNRYS